ncbi:MAG: hypothetical protein A2Z91_03485 [Deltaproteobacteria bacterium GWA2_38_16]|nr:MAG: hypothetical protein A2Z91_03485 [Deltaproteobacteria bacterium GWA2_38_16]OGQ02292.1 MAG: hypothetical protein A3D19_05660 [Deltaproteobacteria bacterium RIFCSPHIGHO2_02_FULL_38_15]OGQ34363.1 MAG: hypothetical protein A3A72_02705 [Deltaproteobacteria bacterium RIFCSPLOWO2_01_FULL_38_9]HBQ22059.1 glutamyl-tRNA amidotransferase [Deltaproteobacteria bacterium]
MSIKENLNEHLKEAMKAGEELRVSTIRLLKAAIKNKEIELIKQIDDPEVIALIRKMVKQRKESIEQFQKGNRLDLANKEQKEIDILNAYLPKEIDSKELETKVQTIIAKVGATSLKQMGEVMKAVGQELSGSADMKMVSDIVRNKLSK